MVKLCRNVENGDDAEMAERYSSCTHLWVVLVPGAVKVILLDVTLADCGLISPGLAEGVEFSFFIVMFLLWSNLKMRVIPN